MRVDAKHFSSFLLIALVGLSAAAPLGALVSKTKIEHEAGRAFQQMKARIPISRDAAAQAYVRCIAEAIIAQLEPPYRDLDWEIVLFRHTAANAFAMPGGKIGVFSGIFRVAQDRDSLAAVIGHEIAHVTSEHALKRARRKLRNSLLATAAAGLIDAGSGGSYAVGVGAEIGLNLPYDRKQESQADAEGLRYMARAGFDPRASIDLWKNMRRRGGAARSQLLSTHPAPDSRIDGLVEQLVPALVLYNKAEGGRALLCE